MGPILLLVAVQSAQAGIFGAPRPVAPTEEELQVLEAEHVRLSEDIEQLASRQLWPAVIRRFEDLGKRGIVPGRQDLVHAAAAARALGDMLTAYERLTTAVRLEADRDLLEAISAIDNNFGHVELVAHNPKGTELTFDEMPFDPDQRMAVEAAQERVRKEGAFTGLLPRGSYAFASQSFTVEPGLSLRIEVSPRMKKTEGEVVHVTTMPIDIPRSNPRK